MSYIVYARKWRPQAFDEVIGQEHITTTLKNAIKQDRVAHAYLFSGPRGVGKTTTARILAKALNCEKGPTPVPCNKCASCKEITEGSSLDIIEIDGASNRGINEIRNLKENVKFSPSSGRFKVYIIDEVHMLTADAFNALLKTLEEPPAHVRFVFATTAGHKVIPTILSRCQRFNFRRLSSRDIAEKLGMIAKREKIKAEEEAILSIVRTASGSMRDAESILDQMATYCKNTITVKDVNKLLGTVAEDALYEFSKCIIGRDAASAIKLINRIIDEGVDPNQFISSLMEYFRNAMLIKQGKDVIPLLDISKEYIGRISKQVEALTTEDILYILYSLINTNYAIRKSPSTKIPLELLAVKLSQRESIVSLDEVLHRLKVLEKEIDRGDAKQGQLPGRGTDNAIVERPKPNLRADSIQQNDNDGSVPALADSEGPESNELHAELYRIREAMPQAIKNIKQQKIYIASCLDEGKLMSFKDNKLTVGFLKKNSFHKESIEKPQNKKLIEDELSKALGSKISLEFIIIKDEKASSDGEAENTRQEEQERNPLKKALADPIVKTALDIFDGNVMKFM